MFFLNVSNIYKVIYKMNSAYGKSKNSDKGFKIFATKNYLLLQNKDSNKTNTVKVFNITDMGYEEQTDQEGFDLTLQENKLSNNSNFIFAFQKNNLYSSFISVVETEPNEGLTLINLFEMVVPQKPQSDFFSNMRFPMLIPFFLNLYYCL